MNRSFIKLENSLGITLLGLLLFSGVAFGWTGPTGTPPNNNVEAPINVGTTGQVKDGTLGVDGLAVFGNTLLNGTSPTYLNFGATSGSSGYGIRDNAGTLEHKNSGGIWQSLQTIINNYISLSGGSRGVWSVNGVKYYYSGGNVGIGTSNPSYPLDVVGTTRLQGAVYMGGTAADSSGYYACVNVDGQVTRGGSCALSDARLKKNIEPISSALEKITALRGVYFNWKDEAEDEVRGREMGLIAQDVEKQFPEAVITNDDGMKALKYDALVGALVEAIKEQERDMQQLKRRIEVMEAEGRSSH